MVEPLFQAEEEGLAFLVDASALAHEPNDESVEPAKKLGFDRFIARAQSPNNTENNTAAAAPGKKAAIYIYN